MILSKLLACLFCLLLLGGGCAGYYIHEHPHLINHLGTIPDSNNSNMSYVTDNNIKTGSSNDDFLGLLLLGMIINDIFEDIHDTIDDLIIQNDNLERRLEEIEEPEEDYPEDDYPYDDEIENDINEWDDYPEEDNEIDNSYNDEYIHYGDYNYDDYDTYYDFE